MSNKVVIVFMMSYNRASFLALGWTSDMQIPFTKMQALGNDFVVINNIAGDVSLCHKDIQKISGRYLGVGCDQVLILYSPPQELTDVDFFYRIFNSDGSEAGQCVNGVRCLHKFVHSYEISKKERLVFATKDTKTTTFLNSSDEISAIIQGPEFEPNKIPFMAEVRSLRYSIQLENRDNFEIGAVSIGNPHVVNLVENVDEILVENIGNLISNHAVFPERTNVNFMQILDNNHIKLRGYERGVGETLSCGSGACASVVIGRSWGFLDSKVVVKLPIGDLVVEWNEKDNTIAITGAADLVFIGKIIL